MNKTLPLIVALAAATATTGCAGFKKAMGVEKSAPDEFRVVTKAPLVIPPDYALRPPRPGDPRPQELRPDADARAALFGQDIGQQASEGEKLLVAKAGAEAVDPNIRSQIDLEGAALVRKPDDFADRIMSFGRSNSDAAPLNPEQEAERLATQEAARRAIGDGQVVIKREEAGIKLPGL